MTCESRFSINAVKSKNPIENYFNNLNFLHLVDFFEPRKDCYTFLHYNDHNLTIFLQHNTHFHGKKDQKLSTNLIDFDNFRQ